MTDPEPLPSDQPGEENPENTAANIERARTLAETDDVEREASQS